MKKMRLYDAIIIAIAVMDACDREMLEEGMGLTDAQIDGALEILRLAAPERVTELALRKQALAIRTLRPTP